MSLNDHYADKEKAEKAALERETVERYNKLTSIIPTILEEMIALFQNVKPEKCDWVIENGKRVAAWILFENSDDYGWDGYALMTDGRFVHLTREGSRLEVDKTLKLTPIKSTEDSLIVPLHLSKLAVRLIKMIKPGEYPLRLKFSKSKYENKWNKRIAAWKKQLGF